MPLPAGVAVYVSEQLPTAGPFELTGPEGRHAATVRRTRVGEQLVLTDGAGGWTVGTVTAVSRDRLSAVFGATHSEPSAQPAVTVVQALPKGDRSELAVDLATEAGADRLVPWSAERCVARWVGEKAARGEDRWRLVAREAAKQSRRVRFPQVEPLSSTAQLTVRIARLVAAGGLAVVLHESGVDSIASLPLHSAGEILLIVGPEGGISDAELGALTVAGARPVRLGPEVLRTSTAAAVALGALGVLTSRWGRPASS